MAGHTHDYVKAIPRTLGGGLNLGLTKPDRMVAEPGIPWLVIRALSLPAAALGRTSPRSPTKSPRVPRAFYGTCCQCRNSLSDTD
jgi:hypothetical protein